MILWILGCYPQPQAQSSNQEIEFRDPNIITIEKICENDQWKFTVQTDAWTGNGVLIIATGQRSERHPLSSYEATEDGFEDNLRVFLSVIPDWQEFSAGSSTGWLCSEESELSIAVSVYHPNSGEATDCLYWGEDIWEDSSTVVDCEAWE